MPHRYSHVAPVLGAITIALRPETDPALLALLAKHPMGACDDSTIAADLMHQTLISIPGVFVHEWAHILQSAAYPLLYLRAARERRLLGEKWRYLAKNPGKYDLPLTVELDRDVANNYIAEKSPMHIAFLDEYTVRVDWAERDKVQRGTLTENDLIEEDASIFEYRVEKGGWGTGDDYHRWIHQRSSYSAAFSFLSQHVSRETAYGLIPIATRIAFRTTRPLYALALALNGARIEGVDRHGITEDNEEYWEFVLGLYVKNSLGPANDLSANLLWKGLDTERGFISDEQHERILEETKFLPIYPMARRQQEGKDIERFMRRPWEHILDGVDNLSADAWSMFPPAVVFELSEPARLVVWAKEGGSKNLVALLKLKMLLDVELSGHTPLRGCPHQACGYHGTKLCAGYFPVPTDYHKCGFPALFELCSGHRISAAGDSIYPIGGM